MLAALATAGLGPLAPNSPLTPVDSPLGLAVAAAVARRQLGQAVTEQVGSVGSNPTLTSQTFALTAAAAETNSPPLAMPTQGAPDQLTGVIQGWINGIDPEGGTVSYAVTGTPPASGSVTLNPTTGAFKDSPTQLARFAAHDMGSGPDFDSFTVAVTDGQLSTPVTVRDGGVAGGFPVEGTTAAVQSMGMAVSATKSYVANQARIRCR